MREISQIILMSIGLMTIFYLAMNAGDLMAQSSSKGNPEHHFNIECDGAAYFRNY